MDDLNVTGKGGDHILLVSERNDTLKSRLVELYLPGCFEPSLHLGRV